MGDGKIFPFRRHRLAVGPVVDSMKLRVHRSRLGIRKAGVEGTRSIRRASIRF